MDELGSGKEQNRLSRVVNSTYHLAFPTLSLEGLIIYIFYTVNAYLSSQMTNT
jgi:hypothetical protein